MYLPPLRRRGEDILLLANHFAARMSFELGREEIPQFSENAVRALFAHRWPGNVRELKNVVERAVYRSDNPRIVDIDFDPFRRPYEPTRVPEHRHGTPPAAKQPSVETSYREAVRQFQLRLIAKALQDAKYSQKAAAARLGLTYHQFRGLYRKFATELRRL